MASTTSSLGLATQAGRPSPRKRGEGVAHAGDLAGSRQVLGQMSDGPARRGGRTCADGVQVERQPGVVSAVPPWFRSARTPARSVPERVAEAGWVVVDEVAQEVQLAITRQQVSSTPGISSMPSRAASGRATARAEIVSWSVIASAVRARRRPRRRRPRRASKRRRNASYGRADRPERLMAGRGARAGRHSGSGSGPAEPVGALLSSGSSRARFVQARPWPSTPASLRPL